MPGAQINIIKVKKSLPWKNEYNICKKKKHKNPFGWNLWSDYKVYFNNNKKYNKYSSFGKMQKKKNRVHIGHIKKWQQN